MRRRRPWIVVAVLIAAFATVALLLWLTPTPRTHFDFLAGPRPVHFPSHFKKGPWEQAYTVKADFKEFRKLAAAELLAKGYAEQDVGRNADSMALYLKATPDGEGPTVGIYRDLRYRVDENGRFLESISEPGWLVIEIDEGAQPGVFDRLRAILGL